MSRLDDIALADLAPEVRAVLDSLPSAKRPILAGPNSVLIRLPDVCASLRDLSIRLRERTRIDERLLELMVLTVARDWRAEYAWCAHETPARKAGLSDDIIEALRRGDHSPPFERDDERIIFDLVRQLQVTKRISDATYAAAHELLGENVLIELVVAIGLYNLMSIVLDAFEVRIPEGTPPPFAGPATSP